MKRPARGFTLVELMIVVAIIGLVLIGVIGAIIWAVAGGDDEECCPCQPVSYASHLIQQRV